MRSLVSALCALALAVPFPAAAGNQRIGVITATTTSKNNGDTAVPFTIKDDRIEVQCDAAACVREGSSSSLTASCSSDLKYAADVIFPVHFSSGPHQTRYLAVVAASGTVNCKVVTGL